MKTFSSSKLSWFCGHSELLNTPTSFPGLTQRYFSSIFGLTRSQRGYIFRRSRAPAQEIYSVLTTVPLCALRMTKFMKCW